MVYKARFDEDVWSIITDHYSTQLKDLANTLVQLVEIIDSTPLHDNECIAKVCVDIHDVACRIHGITSNGAPTEGLFVLSKFCNEANQGNYRLLPTRLDKHDFIFWVESALDRIIDTEDDRISALSIAKHTVSNIADQYYDDIYSNLMLVLNRANQCAGDASTIEQELASIVDELTTYVKQ